MNDIPIDKLRAMVALFNNCNETFNQLLRFHDLERVYDAYKASAYDYAPDQWTPRMLKAALAGMPVDDVMPESMK